MQPDNKSIDSQLYKSRRSLYKSNDEMPTVADGWAISYSDLLMILLVFFVIFFSIEQNRETSVIQKLIFSLQENTSAIQEDGENAHHGVGQGSNESKNRQILNDNKDGTSGNGVVAGGHVTGNPSGKSNGGGSTNISYKQIGGTKTTDAKSSEWTKIFGTKPDGKSHNGVFINLTDNLFSLGQFKLSDNSKREINQVLKVIKPYQKDVNIVFIGHTDSMPVNSSNKIIDSNLILSSLRATKAVEYAISQGLDPHWVSAQGVGEHNRNTRSLSIRVLER